MRDNIITGVLLTLISLLVGWYIRQQNRRDRDFIKGIVKGELHEAMEKNNLKLDHISKSLEVIMEDREEMNKKLMEHIFKTFK